MTFPEIGDFLQRYVVEDPEARKMYLGLDFQL